jgi:hypothetical protein
MTPNTREQYSSHIPALKTLMALGWEYLSTADCLAKRGSADAYDRIVKRASHITVTLSDEKPGRR